MKEKTIYCPPETQVLVLRSEGVICTSVNSDMTITDPFDGIFENLW